MEESDIDEGVTRATGSAAGQQRVHRVGCDSRGREKGFLGVDAGHQTPRRGSDWIDMDFVERGQAPER